jgi:hypothetical protein
VDAGPYLTRRKSPAAPLGCTRWPPLVFISRPSSSHPWTALLRRAGPQRRSRLSWEHSLPCPRILPRSCNPQPAPLPITTPVQKGLARRARRRRRAVIAFADTRLARLASSSVRCSSIRHQEQRQAAFRGTPNRNKQIHEPHPSRVPVRPTKVDSAANGLLVPLNVVAIATPEKK